jgi:hypothetical protein
MSKTLSFPEPRPVIRENGDSVVELRCGNTVVAEINWTNLWRRWLSSAGLNVEAEPSQRTVP